MATNWKKFLPAAEAECRAVANECNQVMVEYCFNGTSGQIQRNWEMAAPKLAQFLAAQATGTAGNDTMTVRRVNAMEAADRAARIRAASMRLTPQPA
jgi:hypothetical protein